nr:MAG TPA: hypothetical protein [Caudoviricetes sp.]
MAIIFSDCQLQENSKIFKTMQTKKQSLSQRLLNLSN